MLSEFGALHSFETTGEGANSTGSSDHPSTKACSICGQEKPFSEYYKKRASLESFCKSCKKQKRKEAPQSLVPNPVVASSIDGKYMETKGEHPEATNIEPRNVLNSRFWEDRYGRDLSNADHDEIRSNLKALMRILLPI